MMVYKNNFQHTQTFQKQFHDKYVKPKTYDQSKKVWLNRKFGKTK